MYSLEERRQRGDAIQTWKILTGYDNVEESHFFERYTNDPGRDTRLSTNHLNLKHKNFRNDPRKSSFSVRVARQWNDIPNTVRNCTTLNSFKKNYDDFYGPNRQQTIFEGR